MNSHKKEEEACPHFKMMNKYIFVSYSAARRFYPFTVVCISTYILTEAWLDHYLIPKSGQTQLN